MFPRCIRITCHVGVAVAIGAAACIVMKYRKRKREPVKISFTPYWEIQSSLSNKIASVAVSPLVMMMKSRDRTAFERNKVSVWLKRRVYAKFLSGWGCSAILTVLANCTSLMVMKEYTEKGMNDKTRDQMQKRYFDNVPKLLVRALERFVDDMMLHTSFSSIGMEDHEEISFDTFRVNLLSLSRIVGGKTPYYILDNYVRQTYFKKIPAQISSWLLGAKPLLASEELCQQIDSYLQATFHRLLRKVDQICFLSKNGGLKSSSYDRLNSLLADIIHEELMEEHQPEFSEWKPFRVLTLKCYEDCTHLGQD